MPKTIGWLGIARLGLVQASLGSIVVLTTTTLNRVMVVELALPAILPGFLVALHYAVQLLRPRWGHGSDQGGKRTPWILGGMVVLAIGGTASAVATALMDTNVVAGIAAAIVSFIVIGIGVGCSGTALLVLLATSVPKHRRPAAATVTWIMMIIGFIVTTAVAGHYLDPFSYERLVTVTASVCVIAVVVSVLAVGNMERGVTKPKPTTDNAPTPFRVALKEVWDEPKARVMATFVFVSMLAYNAQDLVLEPFAGAIFNLTPGESTQLTSLQNGGVLLGMIAVAVCGTLFSTRAMGSMRVWRLVACVGSAFVLLMLSGGAIVGAAVEPALRPTVMLLGFVNGAFAVAAIGSMMVLISAGRKQREGVRMGIWGAAQAIAFGLSGILATSCVDLVKLLLDSTSIAYAVVFFAQSALFICAANLSTKLEAATADQPEVTVGEALEASQ